MTKLFECPICQRSFSNGRALGCHKRGHNNRSNVLQIQNMEATFPCPVCSQGFVSARSVYGHMKKHSDRNWRGMIPPTAPAHVHHGIRRSRRHGKAPVNDDINDSGPMQKSLVVKRKKRQYDCTACARSFKSYQALGGHKSHHVRMRSMEEGQNSGAIVPCNGGDQETRNHSGGFRFDLNKLPSEWTDQ